jgi:protein-S-isoprenylcysteine O-methyltransferase Ste14
VSRFAERGGNWLLAQLPLMLAALAIPPWIGTLAAGGDRWMALVLMSAGIVLAGWARASLGAAFTPFPKPVEGGAHVVSGPYRLLRHPMYAAIIALLAGWSVLWESFVGALLTVAIFAVLDLKAAREERWLEEAHPGYAEYRRRTRKLIPFVY